MNNEEIPAHVPLEIQKLIPGFFRIVRRDLQAAKEALKNNDFASVITMGHRFQGDGASYGFSDLSELGIALKNAAKAKNADAAMQYTEKIENYLNRVKVIWK